jgi:hypothetical protein
VEITISAREGTEENHDNPQPSQAVSPAKIFTVKYFAQCVYDEKL